MSASPFSSQEIRATAEVHRDLGPEYHDAVVESFLAKIEKEIEARVDARLANQAPLRRRQLDPATLAKRRLVLKSMALGSAAAGIPLSLVSYEMTRTYGPNPVTGLIVVWILIAAVYGACAFFLRPGWRDRE